MEQGGGIAASPESIHTPAIHFSASSAAALEAAIKAKRKGAINLMYNKHKQQLLKLFGSALPARSQAPSHCPGCGGAVGGAEVAPCWDRSRGGSLESHPQPAPRASIHSSAPLGESPGRVLMMFVV